MLEDRDMPAATDRAGASQQQQSRPLLVFLYTDRAQAATLIESLPASSGELLTCPLSAAGQSWLAELQPDVVLLEPPADKRKLPDACERVRGWTERPIIVLSGEKDELVVARAFEAGIDEYLILPIGRRELSARVEAMLRRFPRKLPAANAMCAGELTLSPGDLSALCQGQKVLLSPIEFRLLSCLVAAAGRDVTHEAIMLQVWGAEYVDSRHYLYFYIRYLREKFEEDPANPKMILSEWGVGYRLEAPAPV